MADNLKDMLDVARRECPEIPDATWQRIERALRWNFGTQRPYIAALRKRSHLEALEDLAEGEDAALIARKLGVTERHVYRLKRLCSD